MAFICLDHDDFQKLGPEAKSSILALLTPEHTSENVETANLDDEDWLFPVSPRLARKCAAKPIDSKSVQLLKIIADQQGRARWSLIRDTMGLAQWQDLKGVLSGLNRRLRSITKDPEAYLVYWDNHEEQYDEDGEFIDGFMKVHPETARSLRKYFQMD